MLNIKSFLYRLLEVPLSWCLRSKVITDELEFTHDSLEETKSSEQPIFYVIRHQSASDILTLKQVCKKLALPDPTEKVVIGDKSFYRTLCLDKPSPVFTWRNKQPTSAIEQGLALLKQHEETPLLNARLIPANIIWGRTPNKKQHRQRFTHLPANIESPSWLKKIFIVLLLGRHSLVRFSESLSFRDVTDRFGSDSTAAKKLLRVTRAHFHQQILAATGPLLLNRKQMFSQLQANPAVKQAIIDEANRAGITTVQAKQQALTLMKEIAGDYNDAMVRLGDRVLAWLWNKLYRGIEVNNATPIRNLAQQGHEIIYLPCHRSHMDYLLLTYVIFQQGLVTPRSAAGINLNFWPAGSIFRKAGAFFIRRSFKGAPLYSTIFREYLSLLFERGYPVKFYTEGGRSRTGRLLPPKTGMLSMTINSMLRGIERPITLVPVYLGYEHVMEVGSYHKELSGNKKQGESIFGVFRALKNLRNYGKGYVNFGTPIKLNEFLNKQAPQWQNQIDPMATQKPAWLNQAVLTLSTTVMTNINQHAAINSVALVALILHNTKNNALAKPALLAQIHFFIGIQKAAPYSQKMTLPTESAEHLLAHVIALNKVDVYQDRLGEVISLSASSALDMRYYRNNIIHCYMLQALICRLLTNTQKIHHDTLIAKVKTCFYLTQKELFLSQTDGQIVKQTEQTLQYLLAENQVKKTEAGYWSLQTACDNPMNIHAVAECAHETLQRIMMVITLVNYAQQQEQRLTEQALASQVVEIAERIALLNKVNAPEFIDKKSQATLIAAMVTMGYLEKMDNEIESTPSLAVLSEAISPLVSTRSLQSIMNI